MGIDFGYNFSASAAFKAVADAVPAYAGLRYPALKDESKPAQAKYTLAEKKDLSNEMDTIRQRFEALPDEAEKYTATPRVGHKLHRITTMTGKTTICSFRRSSSLIWTARRAKKQKLKLQQSESEIKLKTKKTLRTK
jgi:hypothetical protein